jgi:hypothetical protein
VRIFLLVDRIDEWEKVLKLPAAESCELREYYLARRPYRALLVARHGLRLGDCMNRYVDANAGFDRADPGFARVPGEQQSKVTIYRIVSRNQEQIQSAVPVWLLSHWLRRARKDPEGEGS